MSIHIKISYTKDNLKKFNVYALRLIPDSIKYTGLRNFLGDESRTNLSNIIKRPMIPSYLKEKYGDQQKSSHSTISRGNYRDQRTAQRRKLTTTKADTISDKTNEKIRDILAKLSEGNKAKLFMEFKGCEITDDCAESLIDNIYTFAADLDYLIPLYVELIAILKEKNTYIYQQLIKKIIDTTFKPISFDDIDGGEDEKKNRRWRLANIKLLIGIYCRDCRGGGSGSSDIKIQTIKDIIVMLYSQVSPDRLDSLEILCVMLTNGQSILMRQEKTYMDNFISTIEPIVYSKEIEFRYKFMVQDIVELYSCDEDD